MRIFDNKCENKSENSLEKDDAEQSFGDKIEKIFKQKVHKV